MVEDILDSEINFIPAEISGHLAIDLTDQQSDQLSAYLRLLVKWNKSINLVSRKSVKDVLKDRLFDAMLIWREVRSWTGLTHLDIGSGAGFPAIPIHIMAPESKLLMVDPRAKRVAFLSAVTAELHIPNIKIHRSRIECGADADMGSQRFDIVTAQAVTEIDKIVPVATSCLNDTGRYVAVLNANCDNLWQKDRKKEGLAVVQTEYRRPDGKPCRLLDIGVRR